MNYRIFFLLQSIVEEKEKGEVEPKPLRFLQKIEKPIPRPPTPTVDIPSEVNKTTHLAMYVFNSVVFISLLRWKGYKKFLY